MEPVLIEIDSETEADRLKKIGAAFVRVLGDGLNSRILGYINTEGVTALKSNKEEALEEYTEKKKKKSS